jgi:hypothetical protein
MLILILAIIWLISLGLAEKIGNFFNKHIVEKIKNIF